MMLNTCQLTAGTTSISLGSTPVVGKELRSRHRGATDQDGRNREMDYAPFVFHLPLEDGPVMSREIVDHIRRRFGPHATGTKPRNDFEQHARAQSRW